jgi:hypothetical protein
MAWWLWRLRKISQHEYQQNDNDAGENDGTNEIRLVHKSLKRVLYRESRCLILLMTARPVIVL